MSTIDIHRTNSIYLAVLPKGVASPLAKESDEEAGTPAPEPPKETPKAEEKKPEAVKVEIDFTRLAQRIPDHGERRDLLATVHYESIRAGLDPQLVLGVIHHESGFKKYAVSHADARGYMQVMPFWTRVIGGVEHNLFHLRTNLRYGCVILRHYLDRENGDLFRALGRYNGSLGRVEYPSAVAAAMRRYDAGPEAAPVMASVVFGASVPAR
jgi:soluble lytic murein transglycosylase-like protein